MHGALWCNAKVFGDLPRNGIARSDWVSSQQSCLWGTSAQARVTWQVAAVVACRDQHWLAPDLSESPASPSTVKPASREVFEKRVD